MTLLALGLLGRHFRRSHHRCCHTRTSNHHRQYSIVVKRRAQSRAKNPPILGVFPLLGFSSPHARERVAPRARVRARANAPSTARVTRYKFKSHHPPPSSLERLLDARRRTTTRARAPPSPSRRRIHHRHRHRPHRPPLCADANTRARIHVPRLAVDVVLCVVIDAPPIAARALKLIVDIIVVECGVECGRGVVVARSMGGCCTRTGPSFRPCVPQVRGGIHTRGV